MPRNSEEMALSPGRDVHNPHFTLKNPPSEVRLPASIETDNNPNLQASQTSSTLSSSAFAFVPSSAFPSSFNTFFSLFQTSASVILVILSL